VLRRRFGVQGEHTRKLSHFGGGVIVMSLPWALTSHWSVGVLCVAFFAVLVAGRITGVLGSVHDVSRETSGAYLYPLAVYGSYRLANGDALLFCAPMAVMAVADAGAALVGRRIGDTRYRVMDGARSAEGSFTFFALAFGVILAAVAMDGRGGWPGVLLVALVGAAVTTSVEAISVRGVDNLFIPYAAFLVLDRTLRSGLAELGAWVDGMLVALAAIVLAWGPARLKPAGAVAGFLFGTLAYAMGGWAWFVPLGASAAALTVARAPLEDDADLEQVFPALVGSVVVVLAFAHREDTQLYAPFVASLSANTAIGMWMVGEGPARRRWLRVAAGALLPAFAAWTMRRDVEVLWLAGTGLVGLALFVAIRRWRVPGRRLVASAAAGALAYAWGGGIP
jgi:dolichol kinase